MPYIDFLKFCLDEYVALPASASEIDWIPFLAWAEQQSIVGIILGGINDVRCQREDGKRKLQIPFDDLMQWIGYANQIESQNQLLNRRCVEVGAFFKSKGYEYCILKGQGNASMYPNPMLRMSGDIDVWVLPKFKIDSGKWRIREVIRHVRKWNPEARACYHHVDYGEFKGVEVEVHYRPTFMNNLIANRRLQRWMKEHEEEQFHNWIVLPGQEGSVSVPTWEFNVVFQLSHIYRHVIQKGIGLRQLVDYYYLLKSGNNNQLRGESSGLRVTLRQLSLYKIAGAVMYVLREALGMEEKYLIVPVDERRGRLLLSEILKGGDFGQYGTESTKPKGKIARNLDRLKQDLRLVRYFPSECLWEPIFRVYHWFWRLRYNR